MREHAHAIEYRAQADVQVGLAAVQRGDEAEQPERSPREGVQDVLVVDLQWKPASGRGRTCKFELAWT